VTLKTKRDAKCDHVTTKACRPEQKENLNRTASSKIPRLNFKVNIEPKLKIFKKNVSSFSTKMIPANVENIDEFEENNKFLTPEYVNDIYIYLRWLEVSVFYLIFCCSS